MGCCTGLPFRSVGYYTSPLLQHNQPYKEKRGFKHLFFEEQLHYWDYEFLFWLQHNPSMPPHIEFNTTYCCLLILVNSNLGTKNMRVSISSINKLKTTSNRHNHPKKKNLNHKKCSYSTNRQITFHYPILRLYRKKQVAESSSNLQTLSEGVECLK